jgi:hypothetical protein
MTHLVPIAPPAEPMLDVSPRVSVMIPIGRAGIPAEFVGFDGLDGLEHVAIRFVGRHPDPSRPALVRLHSECLTGDIFASARCDCGHQLHPALSAAGRPGHRPLCKARRLPPAGPRDRHLYREPLPQPARGWA